MSKNPKSLEELKRIAKSAGDEISRIEVRERVAEANSLLGRCFKYRNSYSCPEKPSDYWWLYLRVVGVDKFGGLECFEFQIDKYGDLSVRPKRHAYLSITGYTTIRLTEFSRAWESFTNRIWQFEPERNIAKTGGAT